MATRVWVFDTSSLIAVKSAVPRDRHERVFERLTRLVRNGQLLFPREVVGELRRERTDRRRPRAIDWAAGVEARACRVVASYAETRAVLSTIPELIDPAADSGVDEADPYVLALARMLQSAGHDACVVTEETCDAPFRVSLHTACEVQHVPSVRLSEFLRATKIQR